MKKLLIAVLCFAVLLGSTSLAGAKNVETATISLTATKENGRILLTATAKDVTFNALQICIGYDKARLTPCNITSGEAAAYAHDMIRYEQEVCGSKPDSDGWASYFERLDTKAGTMECVISVDPSTTNKEMVDEAGYVAAGADGMPLFTLSFMPKENETLYADSIMLAGNTGNPTGIVIATDQTTEAGQVVGITDGSVVKINLSQVAEPGNTPGGNDMPKPPINTDDNEEKPTTPLLPESDGNDGQGSHIPPDKNSEQVNGERLSDTIVDIAGHWAEAPIRQLIDAGILTGYGDKTFRPAQNLTRAEFAIILARTFQLSINDTEAAFVDCTGYAVPYINAVDKAGYMNGTDRSGHFSPNRNITREETVTALARAMEIAGGPELTFPDKNEIAAWAVESVKAAVTYQIVQGRPEGFAPHANITRAEAAKMIAGIR